MKRRVKDLSIFPNLNRYINQDSVGTQNKGWQEYQRTIISWIKGRNYTQELGDGDLGKVKIQGKNLFWGGSGLEVVLEKQVEVSFMWHMSCHLQGTLKGFGTK